MEKSRIHQDINEDETLMRGKIKDAGGRLRFDHYMQEHLYGENGYYTKRVEIGANGHWVTDASDPDFARLIYAYLGSQNVSKGDFVEVGGGTGIFKRNLLGLGFEGNYISVDSSPKLAKLQEQIDGKPALMGSAVCLPLEGETVDGIVFANELLDALPCRVLQIQHQLPKAAGIAYEGFVIDGDRGPELVYLPVERDEFIDNYEKYLNFGNPQRISKTSSLDGQIDSVSPSLVRVFNEIFRVLKPGKKALFVDYGIKQNYPNMERKKRELPYYIHRQLYLYFEGVIGFPYQTDITFHVDFDYCAWLVAQRGKSKPDFALLADLVDRITKLDPECKISGSSHLREARGFGYLELTNQH